MQVVEQHIIERGDPRYSIIDQMAFKSKNLYGNCLGPQGDLSKPMKPGKVGI